MQDVTSNEICSTTLTRKIRLCTITLNADQFRGKVKFLPKEDQVEADCKKKTVLVDMDISEIQGRVKMVYEQWMMICKAIHVGTNEVIMFHISRGYHANTLIVYKPTINDMYSAHAGLSRVSLVSDIGLTSSIQLYNNDGK